MKSNKIFNLKLFIGISLFLANAHVFAQDSFLKGKWENAYGSIMEITQFDLDSGSFGGTYSSSTGSSGKYALSGQLIGAASPSPDTHGIVFTLSWASLDGSTKDPSQFWTSAMSGTLYDDKGIMEVINTIAASEPFTEVQINEPGMYPETLIFKKVSNITTDNPSRKKLAETSEFPKKRKAFAQGVSGTWMNKNLDADIVSVTLNEQPNSEGLYDTVTGSIKYRKGTSLGIHGRVSNISQSNRRSVSFYDPVDNHNSTTIVDELRSFVGLYDEGSNSLNLLIFRVYPVNYENKYVGTSIDQVFLTKEKIKNN
ncbi:MAG: hypothetical protein GDA42_00330 [Ekhidna sp.]|nr:hypothetical protein [Ekhidna sp.]